VKGSPSRLFVIAACLALALASATVLAACGDDSAQELTFELEGKGKEATITAPESAESGEAEITVVNNTDKDGELQMIRVDGDHSAEETIEVLDGAQQGKPFPDWFFAGGGVGVVEAGEERTVTQVLEPGTYYAFDLEAGQPKPDAVPAIEVTGDESEDELEADATVDAFEYGFKEEGLTSGETEVAFKNVGAQPHHLLISPLEGDATAEDVEKAFKADKGRPPLSEEGGEDTAVIEGGESQLVTLDLKPGRYAFYCFISDREGGPPHALKGMVDEFEIE
jgi:Copper binding proteins, plastocyanin/azurin family